MSGPIRKRPSNRDTIKNPRRTPPGPPPAPRAPGIVVMAQEILGLYTQNQLYKGAITRIVESGDTVAAGELWKRVQAEADILQGRTSEIEGVVSETSAEPLPDDAIPITEGDPTDSGETVTLAGEIAKVCEASA